MPRDLGNHVNNPKSKRAFFPYEIKLFLNTFGQNSGNNGFNVIIQKILQASYSHFVPIVLLICSLD